MVDACTGHRWDREQVRLHGTYVGVGDHSLGRWMSHGSARHHGYMMGRASRPGRRGPDSPCRCRPSSMTASEHDERPDRMNRVRPSSPPLVTLRELYGTKSRMSIVLRFLPFGVSCEASLLEHHRVDTVLLLVGLDQQHATSLDHERLVVLSTCVLAHR